MTISCKRAVPTLAGLATVVTVAASAFLPPITDVSAQQPCNPITDGTYCATQMGSGGSRSSAAGKPALPPIGSIADSIVPSDDQPATLGAITFQGYGSRCIGLLRQSKCN